MEQYSLKNYLAILNLIQRPPSHMNQLKMRIRQQLQTLQEYLTLVDTAKQKRIKTSLSKPTDNHRYY